MHLPVLLAEPDRSHGAAVASALSGLNSSSWRSISPNHFWSGAIALKLRCTDPRLVPWDQLRLCDGTAAALTPVTYPLATLPHIMRERADSVRGDIDGGQ